MKISSVTIPRNSEIASATMEQIIHSPLLQKNLKPIEVRAGLSHNINSSPVGSLCITEAGIAFLTSGSMKFTGNTNWPTIIGGSLGGNLLGGVLGAGIGALVAASIAGSHKKEKIGDLVNNPHSLFISYADIVSMEYQKSSKALQLTRQFDHGLTESISLVPIDQECVALFILARFNYEKRLYADHILSHIQFGIFSDNLTKEMEIRYGPKWKTNNMDEFERQSCLYVDTRLGENGLDGYLRERLSLFKGIPFLAEFFG